MVGTLTEGKIPCTLMGNRLFRGRPVPCPPSLPSSVFRRLFVARCSRRLSFAPFASLRWALPAAPARLRVSLRSSLPSRSFGLPAPETAFSYLVSAPFWVRCASESFCRCRQNGMEKAQSPIGILRLFLIRELQYHRSHALSSHALLRSSSG